MFDHNIYVNGIQLEVSVRVEINTAFTIIPILFQIFKIWITLEE